MLNPIKNYSTRNGGAMNKTAHAVRSLLKSNAAFDVSHISYCASDATALAMRCYFNADQMSAPHMYLMLRRVCVWGVYA